MIPVQYHGGTSLRKELSKIRLLGLVLVSLALPQPCEVLILGKLLLFKANLPLLQRELLHCARAAKQTPSQYLAQHEHLLLNTSIASPADSTELLMEVHGNGKRPSPER